MTSCSFCGREIQKGTGFMYVKKDATIFHFCAKKCEKNALKLGRSRRKTKWTVRYHQIKESHVKADKAHKEKDDDVLKKETKAAEAE